MNPITDIKDALTAANFRRERDNLQSALRAVQDTLVLVTKERDQWQRRYTEILAQRNVLREEVEALRAELDDVQDALDEMRGIALLQRQGE